MTRTRIVIFAKAPVPGKVKTRLIPALGEIGAARLAQEMLLATTAEAIAAGLSTPELCVAPDHTDPEWQQSLPDSDKIRLSDQGGGDLGERLMRAAKRVLLAGETVLLIGTDCPGLERDKLTAAAAELLNNDAVIHPTLDGGYALLGLRRFDASVFTDIAWSGPTVAADTISRVEALGWSLSIGETLRDIDVPADLNAASGI
ncbi:MAG: TIGR04282 family arsenosugar biosynthesis glycosyltransferase [Pseudomonadota bacterium]|nr:TIGR04282 family arsenosugar biosynthesis glycosyltransferase [Pseudomonadota bacterium]